MQSGWLLVRPRCNNPYVQVLPHSLLGLADFTHFDCLRTWLEQNPTALQTLFDEIDRNADNVISFEEMKATLYGTIPGK